jgi:hypothetical protein
VIEAKRRRRDIGTMATAKGGDDGSNGEGRRVMMWEAVTAREGTKREKR